MPPKSKLMNNELCWDTDRAVVSYLRGLNDSKRVASPQSKSGMGDSSQILKIQSLVITHKQLRRVGSDSSGQLSWSVPLTLLLYRDGLLVHLLAACFFSAVLATYKSLERRNLVHMMSFREHKGTATVWSDKDRA